MRVATAVVAILFVALLVIEMAPFGGVKESGSGREASKYGMDDYLEIKYMLIHMMQHTRDRIRENSFEFDHFADQIG